MSLILDSTWWRRTCVRAQCLPVILQDVLRLAGFCPGTRAASESGVDWRMPPPLTEHLIFPDSEFVNSALWKLRAVTKKPLGSGMPEEGRGSPGGGKCPGTGRSCLELRKSRTSSRDADHERSRFSSERPTQKRRHDVR